MFAPPVKAPKAKTASQTALILPHKPSQFFAGRSGAGLSNQAIFWSFQSKTQKAESLTSSTLAPNLGHPVSMSRPGDFARVRGQPVGRPLAWRI